MQPCTYIFTFYTTIRTVFLVQDAISRKDAVLKSTHTLCFEQEYEKYQIFLSENFPFLVVKFAIYLNRRVFVMEYKLMLRLEFEYPQNDCTYYI